MNTTPAMTADRTIAELNDGIFNLKMKKAPAEDGVCHEVIRHMDPAARKKLQSVLEH